MNFDKTQSNSLFLSFPLIRGPAERNEVGLMVAAVLKPYVIWTNCIFAARCYA